MIDDPQAASPPDSHPETFAALRAVLRPVFHPERIEAADEAITDLLLALCAVPYEPALHASFERRTGPRRSPAPSDHASALPTFAEAS